ncbi:MAG: phage tail tape measure protein, partial [Hyphomicrobiaceae bacterium]
MAVNLGTAFGMVKIDASGVTAGMQTARESFDSGLSQIGPGIQNIGNQMSSLGGAMAGMTAPLVAGFGLATKGAVDFDEAVTNIGSVMNLSRDQVEALKDQLSAIGGESVQGPQAVAEAYYDIAGGVQDASTHMAILQASIATATAGNSDLRGTTNALISVMNSYKFGADKAAYSSNVLTKTVGMGVGTMDEFASALPTVTGLANSLNISFDDLAGMTAYLTTQGNTASQATTQLGAMMTALMKPNEAMMKGLSQLGFKSGEAAIKQLGLRGAFEALAGTSAATTDGMAAMVGTTEALRGVTSLASDSVDGFLNTFTSGIEGATDAAAAIQMEGPAAQFGLLKSMMSEASNTIGEALIPMLVDLAKEVRPVIKSIVDWIKQNPTLVAGIAKVVGVVALIGSAMMVLGPIISGVGVVLGVLLSPIGLIIAAVAGLFLAFQNNFLGIRDLLQPVIDWISSKFAGLIGSIQNFGQNMEQGGIGEAISSVLANILQFFGGTEEGTMSMARNIVDGFINVFTSIVDFVQTTVIPGIQTFFTFLGNAWDLIGPALANLANWFLTDVLPQVVGFVTTVVIPAVQSFIGFLGSLWAIVSPALGALA